MAAEDVIKQCIFCQMCMGRAGSFKVFEDSECIAVLDIRPANPGHLLLMPKEHYSILPQLPSPLLEHLFGVVQKLSKVVIQSIGATGTNIMIANGLAAGQRAQHVMIHIIPRAEKDGVSFMIPQKDHPQDALLNMHEQLRKKMLMLMGKSAESPKVEIVPKKVEQPEIIDVVPKVEVRNDGLDAVANILKVKKQQPTVDLDKISKIFGGSNG